MAGHPRARHAVGVADRDGAAVDVHPVIGDAEHVLDIENLDRERLVQFPQVDVGHFEAEPVEQFGHREDRADAHLVGLGAGRGHADIAAERGQAALGGEARLHDHAGRGAVGELAGIAGGDLRVGAHHRLQALQALEAGVGAVALVLGDGDLAHRDLAGRLVLDRHGRGHGDDLVVELAGGLGGGGALLRLQRISVLAVAGDAVALADDLGGADHRHVDVLVHRDELGIAAEPHLGGLHHRDRFDAAGDADLHAVDDDLLGGGGDRHQARRALAVDRHARHGDRQAGAQGGGAADRRLHALLERGADDDVVDLGRIDARALDRRADRMGGQRRGGRGVERAAIGLADRGAGGGDDDGVAGHGNPFRYGDSHLTVPGTVR